MASQDGKTATRHRSLMTRTHAPRMRTINAIVVIIAAVMSLMLLQTTQRATEAQKQMHAAAEAYIECNAATQDLGEASNYLTSNARIFSVTYETQCVANYYNEVNVVRRRDKALETLGDHAEERAVQDILEQALLCSNTLAEREGHAMRLVAEGCNLPLEGDLEPLTDYDLTQEETELSSQDKIQLGQEMLFGAEYRSQKDEIDSYVSKSIAILVDGAKQKLDLNIETLEKLLLRQRVLTVALLVIVVAAVNLFIFFVLWPLSSYSSRISEGLSLVPSGAHELRLFADDYNVLYEENRNRYDSMRHKANHDPLTGLLNRGAYDDLLQESSTHVALMLVDVDYFKTVNDTYGHETGDKILKKVANLLTHTFRNTDFPCRIGGDEFAVIVTNVKPYHKDVIRSKIAQIREGLADTSDGLPTVTLSIGVAFSDLQPADGVNLFKVADSTLYIVKERGRDGYGFSDESLGV